MPTMTRDQARERLRQAELGLDHFGDDTDTVPDELVRAAILDEIADSRAVLAEWDNDRSNP